MPGGKVHRAISKKRAGKDFAALHSWMDKDEHGLLGVDHRSKNHYYTSELKDFVYSNFGGSEAVSEWLFHIALDNLDTSVNNDWNHNGCDINFYKFCFEPNGFIHFEEDLLEDYDVKEEFPEDFEEDY